MVKVKAFQGYTYAAEDYSTLFNFNHEGLSTLPEFKKTYLHRVSTQAQIKTGMLLEDAEEHLYIYRQIYEDREMVGVMLEASIEVTTKLIFRIMRKAESKSMRKLYVDRATTT